jgi:hypothetical protein
MESGIFHMEMELQLYVGIVQLWSYIGMKI